MTLEKINEIINQLRAINENPNNRQTTIVIEKKFSSLRRELFRKRRSAENWELEDLLETLKDLILTEEETMTFANETEIGVNKIRKLEK